MLPANVVLVEDDPDCRDSVDEALRKEGNRIISVRNGIEALDAIDRIERPAVILLDIHTPDMDGVEFLTELRQRFDRDDFNVVVMSGAVDVEWFERIPGVVAILRKPFELEKLVAIVSDFSTRRPGQRAR